MDAEKIIIEKIISDAESAAAKVIEAAEAEAAKIAEDAKRAEEERYNARVSAANAQARELALHRLKLAELENGRKKTGEMQGLIDSAYSEAKDRIFRRPDTEYCALIMSMLKKYASDGDTVIAGEGDRARIDEKFVSKAAAELKIRLSLSKSAGAFKGGIVLSGKDYDKNLTFDSLFKVLRQETEAEVSGILFKGGRA